MSFFYMYYTIFYRPRIQGHSKIILKNHRKLRYTSGELLLQVIFVANYRVFCAIRQISFNTENHRSTNYQDQSKCLYLRCILVVNENAISSHEQNSFCKMNFSRAAKFTFDLENIFHFVHEEFSPFSFDSLNPRIPAQQAKLEDLEEKIRLATAKALFQ